MSAFRAALTPPSHLHSFLLNCLCASLPVRKPFLHPSENFDARWPHKSIFFFLVSSLLDKIRIGQEEHSDHTVAPILDYFLIDENVGMSSRPRETSKWEFGPLQNYHWQLGMSDINLSLRTPTAFIGSRTGWFHILTRCVFYYQVTLAFNLLPSVICVSFFVVNKLLNETRSSEDKLRLYKHLKFLSSKLCGVTLIYKINITTQRAFQHLSLKCLIPEGTTSTTLSVIVNAKIQKIRICYLFICLNVKPESSSTQLKSRVWVRCVGIILLGCY